MNQGCGRTCWAGWLAVGLLVLVMFGQSLASGTCEGDTCLGQSLASGICEGDTCQSQQQEEGAMIQVRTTKATMAVNYSDPGDVKTTYNWCVDMNFPYSAADLQVGVSVAITATGQSATMTGSLYLGVSFGLKMFKLAIGVTGYAGIKVTLPDSLDWSAPSSALEWTFKYIAQEVSEDCVLLNFMKSHESPSGKDIANFIGRSMDMSKLPNVDKQERIDAASELVECWWAFLDQYDVGDGNHPFVKGAADAKKALDDDDDVKAYNVYTDFWTKLFMEFFLGCNSKKTNCNSRDLSFDDPEHWDTWDYKCNEHIDTNYQDIMANQIKFKFNSSKPARLQVMSRLCWVMKSGFLLGDKAFDVRNWAWRDDSMEARNFRNTACNVFMRPFFPIAPVAAEDVNFPADKKQREHIVQQITNQGHAGNEFKHMIAQAIKDRRPIHQDGINSDAGSDQGAKKLSNLMLWTTIMATEKQLMLEKLTKYYDELKKSSKTANPKEQCKDCSCGVTELKVGGKLTAAFGKGSFCSGYSFAVDIGKELVWKPKKEANQCDLILQEKPSTLVNINVGLGDQIKNMDVSLGLEYYMAGKDKGKTTLSVTISQATKHPTPEIGDLLKLAVPPAPLKVDQSESKVDIIKGKATTDFLAAVSDFLKTDKAVGDFVSVVKALAMFFVSCAKAYADSKIDDVLKEFYDIYAGPNAAKDAILKRLTKTFSPEVKLSNSTTYGISISFSMPKLPVIAGSSVQIQAARTNTISASASPPSPISNLILSTSSNLEIFEFTVDDPDPLPKDCCTKSSSKDGKTCAASCGQVYPGHCGPGDCSGARGECYACKEDPLPKDCCTKDKSKDGKTCAASCGQVYPGHCGAGDCAGDKGECYACA